MFSAARELRRILVADDDPDDRELIAEAFRESGFEGNVEFAFDGRELVERLGADARAGHPLPQLVLLDLNMPRLDGVGVLATLRETNATRALPVVMLTTSGAQHDIAECFRHGANSYCTKPLDFRGLVALATDIERWWFKVSRLPPSNL